jgi:hypothetical protein
VARPRFVIAIIHSIMRVVALRLPPGIENQAAWRVGLLCVASIACAGCGSGLSSVSGKLTLDGQPLARTDQVEITIMFYPESGIGAPAAGIVDESGRYSVFTGRQDGIAPGDYVVTLAAVETKPAGPGRPPSKRVITPQRYTNPRESELRAAVQPGRNTFDFELTSASRS